MFLAQILENTLFKLYLEEVSPLSLFFFSFDFWANPIEASVSSQSVSLVGGKRPFVVDMSQKASILGPCQWWSGKTLPVVHVFSMFLLKLSGVLEYHQRKRSTKTRKIFQAVVSKMEIFTCTDAVSVAIKRVRVANKFVLLEKGFPGKNFNQQTYRNMFCFKTFGALQSVKKR